MADPADRTDEDIHATVDEGVAICTEAAKHRELVPTGKCRYCFELVEDGQLFCPPEVNECAKDWAHAQARKKANGK